MKLCSMLRDSLEGRGVWGRMDICICMAESLRLSTQNFHNIVNQLYLKTKKVFFLNTSS